jgi:hypothetical protein
VLELLFDESCRALLLFYEFSESPVFEIPGGELLFELRAAPVQVVQPGVFSLVDRQTFEEPGCASCFAHLYQRFPVPRDGWHVTGVDDGEKVASNPD